MTFHIKPPWRENCEPTPAEFAAWFARCPKAQQEEVAKRVLSNSRIAYQCFLHNHEALEDEVRFLRIRSARYRLAWESARRWRWAFRQALAPKETA